MELNKFNGKVLGGMKGDTKDSVHTSIALLARGVNRSEGFKRLFENCEDLKEVEIKEVAFNLVSQELEDLAKQAEDKKLKTLLFTNLVASEDRLLEVKDLSKGYMKVVSLGQKESTMYGSDQSKLLKKLIELVELNKAVDSWFSYSNKYFYLDVDGYVFSRFGSNLTFVGSISKFESIDRFHYKDGYLIDKILLLPEESNPLVEYSSIIEMVKGEVPNLKSLIWELSIPLSNFLPDEVITKKESQLEVNEGWEISIDYDVITVTNNESPYSLHIGIKEFVATPEVYITDKSYDGDITSLVNVNTAPVSCGKSVPQQVQYLLNTFVLNKALWVEAEYNCLLIQDNGKFTVVNKNFIDYVIDTYKNITDLIGLEDKLPRVIRHEGHRSSISIEKWPGNFILITTLIPE